MIYQYIVASLLEIMEVWSFQPKNITQKPALCISFTTVWQYWLGIAKPKNVFRLTLNPFQWRIQGVAMVSAKIMRAPHPINEWTPGLEILS